MKRTIIGLVTGLVLAASLLPAQRGDLYGTRALLSLEEAFSAGGTLIFPNYAAAPVACGADYSGSYYFNTTTNDTWYCDGTNWVTFGVPIAAGSGTQDYVVRFNAAAELEDSDLMSEGPPAAGGSGSIIDLTVTLNVMNGNDTVDLIEVIPTNADHTGANNTLTGLNLWGIIGDDQASEYAIQAGVGWDAHLWGNTSVLMMGSDLDYISFLDQTFGVVFAYDLEHNPTANHQWMTINAESDVMTGNDYVQRGIFIDIDNANHTTEGGDNFLAAIAVDGITGDADAYETVLDLGGGFDTHITFTEVGATPPDNPPAGQVAMFVDDNADYSGGGGNDCILGMIDSTGNITIVATLVLNGACP